MGTNNITGESSESLFTDLDSYFNFPFTPDFPSISQQETQNQEPTTQYIPGGSQDNPAVIMDNSSIPSSFTNKKSRTRKPRGQAVDWSYEMTTVLL